MQGDRLGNIVRILRSQAEMDPGEQIGEGGILQSFLQKVFDGFDIVSGLVFMGLDRPRIFCGEVGFGSS